MNRKRRHPGELIKRYLRPDGPLTLSELARRSGVKQPTLWRIVHQETVEPRHTHLDAIARALGISVDALLGDTASINTRIESPPSERYNVSTGPDILAVPLISWVQAGKPDGVADPFRPGAGERGIYTSRRVGPRTYALRVRGDSMENPHGKPTFPDGCIIIVDPDKQADIGSFVVVRFDATLEATFKQLIEDAGRRYLRPLNPRYPLIPIDGNASLCGTWVQTIIDSE